jgi:hypothetical protein
MFGLGLKKNWERQVFRGFLYTNINFLFIRNGFVFDKWRSQFVTSIYPYLSYDGEYPGANQAILIFASLSMKTMQL